MGEPHAGIFERSPRFPAPTRVLCVVVIFCSDRCTRERDFLSFCFDYSPLAAFIYFAIFFDPGNIELSALDIFFAYTLAERFMRGIFGISRGDCTKGRKKIFRIFRYTSPVNKNGKKSSARFRKISSAIFFSETFAVFHCAIKRIVKILFI